ncbi:protein of unknown function [Burkholderia multivorans]
MALPEHMFDMSGVPKQTNAARSRVCMRISLTS